MIDYFLTKKESMGVYLPSFCDNFCFLDLLCLLIPSFWFRLKEHLSIRYIKEHLKQKYRNTRLHSVKLSIPIYQLAIVKKVK